jgi:hypothetical protein
VLTIPPTVRKRHIREGFLVGHIVGIDPVPKAIVGETVERRTRQHTHDSPQGNVGDIV